MTIRNYMCIYSFVQKKYRKVKPEAGEAHYLEVVGRNGMGKWGRENRVRGGDGTFLSRSFHITLILRTMVMLHTPLENK